MRSITVWRSWPTALMYFPVLVYMLVYGLVKKGNPFLFALANPELPLAGFAGESKFSILSILNPRYTPKSILVPAAMTWNQVVNEFNRSGVQYPVVVKPDCSEGGFLVDKVENLEELQSYHNAHAIDYIIQDFVALKQEFSLLFYKLEKKYVISSLVIREPVSVIGNGELTVLALLRKQAVTQQVIKKFKATSRVDLNQIISRGQKVNLTFIANTDFGAGVIDINEDIDDTLVQVVSNIMSSQEHLYYGRLDVKADSLEDLKLGNFKILEINGIKGEPLHIYDKKYTLRKAWKEIFKHWKLILQLAYNNANKGFKIPTFSEVYLHTIKHIKNRQQANHIRTAQ